MANTDRNHGGPGATEWSHAYTARGLPLQHRRQTTLLARTDSFEVAACFLGAIGDVLHCGARAGAISASNDPLGWAQREAFMDGGRPLPQRLEATVLFVDMVGSTAHAEKLDPAALMEWTNRFMEVMAREVGRAGGVVDDYFGDGLKATFGAPIARTSEDEIAADARHAIDCALAMASELEALNRANESASLPTIAMRIGLDSGTVVAGCLGSSDRLKYTVMGDVVVTAARLEQTREVEHDFEAEPCRILASERMLARVGPLPGAESIGRMTVRGRTEPIGVYQVSAGEKSPTRVE